MSNLFSEGGTLDRVIKVPQGFTKTLERICEELWGGKTLCVCVGWVRYVSLYTHPKHARANILTYRFLSRVDYTVLSRPCPAPVAPPQLDCHLCP